MNEHRGLKALLIIAGTASGAAEWWATGFWSAAPIFALALVLLAVFWPERKKG